MGIAIVQVGVVGLLLGEQSLLNLVNIDLGGHGSLADGGFMAHVGFANRDLDVVKSVVGGIGVMYLAVGGLGLITHSLFGLLPHGYSGFDNILHWGLGGIGIAVAGFMGSREMGLAQMI